VARPARHVVLTATAGPGKCVNPTGADLNAADLVDLDVLGHTLKGPLASRDQFGAVDIFDLLAHHRGHQESPAASRWYPSRTGGPGTAACGDSTVVVHPH
jgi:hypothetical protein